MIVLYVALKESLPGSHGGAVHVLEAARHLAARGHTVHVLVRHRAGEPRREVRDGVFIQRVRAPSSWLLLAAAPAVRALARELSPDVVMERYNNFAGAGLLAARELHRGALLEVNAPMVDPPGTRKALVDLRLGHVLRRWAEWQARAATRIVTPLAATVPAIIAREKIREIPWGANVQLFDRARLDPQRVEALRRSLGLEGRRVVAFLGSFRPWHGVRELVEVAQEITAARPEAAFLFVGGGEQFEACRKLAGGNAQIILTGPVAYERAPEYLALAEIGAAPFNPSLHAPLRIGFYWSPLKVHEYMAMGLPVVTIDTPGLNEIVRDGREGLLYPAGNRAALRGAIERLLDDPGQARRLGAAGRARVVTEFSWARHAEKLEAVLDECRGAGEAF